MTRRLHRTDWVLRWEAGQGSGAKDVFDVLGGQLWGSRLSECSVMSPPYCDAVLIVVKAFGTAKVPIYSDTLSMQAHTRGVH